MTIQANSRLVDGVMVVDLSGSITADGGSQELRNTVKNLAAQGNNKILLNLSKVDKVDSCGLGQLVRAYVTVRQAGGELKISNPSGAVHDLLQITKLCSVFDVQDNEASAIAAFATDRGVAAI